jgi:hypothetical protein
MLFKRGNNFQYLATFHPLSSFYPYNALKSTCFVSASFEAQHQYQCVHHENFQILDV